MRYITSSQVILFPYLLFACSFDLHAPDCFVTISSGQGGFAETLNAGNFFGYGVVRE